MTSNQLQISQPSIHDAKAWVVYRDIDGIKVVMHIVQVPETEVEPANLVAHLGIGTEDGIHEGGNIPLVATSIEDAIEEITSKISQQILDESYVNEQQIKDFLNFFAS